MFPGGGPGRVGEGLAHLLHQLAVLLVGGKDRQEAPHQHSALVVELLINQLLDGVACLLRGGVGHQPVAVDLLLADELEAIWHKGAVGAGGPGSVPQFGLQAGWVGRQGLGEQQGSRHLESLGVRAGLVTGGVTQTRTRRLGSLITRSEQAPRCWFHPSPVTKVTKVLVIFRDLIGAIKRKILEDMFHVVYINYW